jgi:hypothetical protein
LHYTWQSNARELRAGCFQQCQELFSMTSKSVQMTWRSRLAVMVSLGLAVTAAACSDGINNATSPSGMNPSSLAAGNPNQGQDTRNFSVTITPTSVQAGAATLHVTVTRDATSGQSQKLGSVEIYVPSAFTIQSVSNLSNANWTSGVSGQTVRVGAVGGNQKLDGATGRISVTFDIHVTSTECDTYRFTAAASNSPYSTEPFSGIWIYTGNPLSVEVTGCVVVQDCDDAPAAPAVANAYLRSLDIRGNDHEAISRSVADHMGPGTRFDGVEKCAVEAYRAAVIAFVDALLQG